MTDSTNDSSRRRFLALGGATAAGSLAGCFGLFSDEENNSIGVSLSDFRGSGPLVDSRGQPGGTSITDLPDLEGSLTVYLGGGEGGLYVDLLDLFEQAYENFTVNHRVDSSSSLANQIIEENENDATQADLFMSVDAGSLGAVANAGATQSLPSEALNAVPGSFQDSDGRWVGFAGRARAIPYNSDRLSESDIPDSVHDFPDAGVLEGAMGWAPTYGAFQSFITAMRLNRSDDVARSWLNGMQNHGVTEYGNEFAISNSAADGELAAGFANHYYSLRVRSARPNAPLELAFTEGDAGALVNVSGLEVLDGTTNAELAGNFVRHVLSSEAQEFFATRTFAYPMISGVAPVGGLPRIDDLNPPDISLTELADVSGTVDLMRDAGVL
ncbi:extracellular solute-binding protein [Haloarcula onubensis]|uniref:Extracellular solute-binding protein n=1 Tax=Haloarcula onubensis TaxID=2950539 RepID=A0ABU2FVB6_9EURY|nr:extracellular solute-binding protein [Halomicroarcula sp. S3CR25-11]MDS0284222.1 extracellular solute-binding protein [Halomicroarcula sp. S3CR25-11]